MVPFRLAVPHLYAGPQCGTVLDNKKNPGKKPLKAILRVFCMDRAKEKPTSSNWWVFCLLYHSHKQAGNQGIMEKYSLTSPLYWVLVDRDPPIGFQDWEP
jgi:hypothetical protein